MDEAGQGNGKGVEKRFLFLGNAVALGGRIRRGADFFIDAVASSCLPITGGRAQASSGKQSFRDLISFESASSSAHGDYVSPARAVEFTQGNHGNNALPTKTTVECSLNWLKLHLPIEKAGEGAKLRAFEVQKLSASLETGSDRRNKSVVPPQAVISGVTIDGHVLNVNIGVDAEAFRHPDPKKPIGTVVAGLGFPGDERVEGVEIIQPNILKVTGIGTIYFGETFAKSDFRRLTLLRVQLGSPYGGELTACDVQQNGTSIPP